METYTGCVRYLVPVSWWISNGGNETISRIIKRLLNKAYLNNRGYISNEGYLRRLEYKVINLLKKYRIYFNKVIKMAFTCNYCNKNFSEKRNMKRHIKSKHEVTNLGCEKCEFTTDRIDCLKRHIEMLSLIHISEPTRP